MSPADAALERLLADGRRHAAALDGDYPALWSILEEATGGGKRFRPALLLLAHDALGGTRPGPAAEVAAAVELLHTAFVVHDDVIDGDDTRRGRPNVSGRFAELARARGADARSVRDHADTAGILAGDLALAGAVRAVALCGAPPTTVRRLLDLFDRALHHSAAGELADVGLALQPGPVSLDEILTMEEHKTAVYSFQLPLQAGAVLAGAAEGVVERLGELGRLLGIAFQLRDDLLGVFGDEEATGKSALTDLRQGKRTPLMAHARTTAAWPEIALLVGDPDLGEPEAARVRELLVDCGSREFIEDLAAGYTDAALRLAAGLGLAGELLDRVAAVSGGALRSAA